MAPPAFGDLGKECRDIFSKGYQFGQFKFESKTSTEKGVNINTNISRNSDTGEVDGHLESKYKFDNCGLTITEKLHLANKFGTTIDIEHPKTKGLKLTFDSEFAPVTGKMTGLVKSTYKHEYLTVNTKLDCITGSTVEGSAVVAHNGWLAGYNTAYDISKSKLKKNNFTLGFAPGDFSCHASVSDGMKIGAQVYHKVNPNLELGVDFASGDDTSLGVGCTYALDKETTVRAKINNASLVGLGYQQKLSNGITLTLSTLIDGNKLNQGGHKFGLGVELKQ